MPSLGEGAERLDQSTQPSQQKRAASQGLGQSASREFSVPPAFEPGTTGAGNSSRQEPTAASAAAQAASPEASSAASSENICNIAQGDSSGQVAEPQNQSEEWRQNGGSVKLASNVSGDAVEQMPGDGAWESAAAESSGGHPPAASSSLAADLVKREENEDQTPAAALIRGSSELPGLAAREQRLAQEAASSEGSGTEQADPEQEHDTPQKRIPMPELQLSALDGSLWDAAALGEEPGLHRTMSASKRKLRPSEDSQVPLDTDAVGDGKL